MSKFIKGSAMVAAGILAALLLNATSIASGANGGFLTAAQPYVTMVDAANDSVVPLITANDMLPSGYKFSKIPDGLGAVAKGDGTVNVFVSHELNNSTNHEGFAKLSLLKLSTTDGSVLDAKYLIDGTEGYERFCSGYLAEGHGFPVPVYFANEEVDDGIVVAVMENGTRKEMPWLGKFSHENTIAVPSFWDKAGKIVLLGFEDGEATESEVYMYVANSFEDLWNGNGQLYVFGALDHSTYNTWDDIYFKNWWVRAQWIPLDWDHATQDEADLHSEAIAKGAFKFIRPEDGATDKRLGFRDRFYMADTGSDVDESDVAIPAGMNGQTWEKGRMYKFEFTDDADPTKIKFRVFMDGNDSRAPGFGVMINPDNIDVSGKKLMIQEDAIGPTRIASTSPYYDITRNAKVLMVDLETFKLEVVAYVNQLPDPAAQHRNWESSGIIDASESFGEGSWLLDIQAHSIQEGGQLLLMKIPGS